VLKPAQLDWIGQQIFHNEWLAVQFDLAWCTGTTARAFPVTGNPRAHFIWYPKDVWKLDLSKESFPTLIDLHGPAPAAYSDWLRGPKAVLMPLGRPGCL